ncbi:MAG TPA: ferritin-like domain-containing protein [Thermomicrobiales bacterium]|nr:ferritin-like domain-containing protein [Thermomicrobiales bacterium]
MRNKKIEHDLMARVAAERMRLATRRGMLGGTAKVVAGGALAMVAVPALGGKGPASAQDFDDDLGVLNYALTLEHLEAAFYRDGLDTFGEDDFEDGVYAELEAIRDHETAHVEALTETVAGLGGEPITPGAYDFGYGDDPEAFLEVAQALENTGVAAYAGVAPSIEDSDLLAAALSIHSVEARHAAYLNTLNDATAFPDAFDSSLTPEEVLEIVTPFIVGAPSAGAAREDNSAAGETVVVDIKGFRYRPEMVEVAVGGTVTWTNQEVIVHTATADEGSFDSGDLSKGDTFSFTFDEPGEYPYFCEYHDNMHGVVVVT